MVSLSYKGQHAYRTKDSRFLNSPLMNPLHVLVSSGPVCIALWTQGTDANTLMPTLLVAPRKSKSFVSDLGVPYLLPASSKLQHTNLSACKKNLRPLIVLDHFLKD